MAAEFRCAPPAIVYRIHYGTDPLTLRDWSAATVKDRLGNETFGHRWDDPAREFRALYTSSTKVGAFIEVLQDLRPKLTEVARLRRIELEDGETLPDLGALPESYFEHLHGCELGITTTPFIDVVHAHIFSPNSSGVYGLKQVKYKTALPPIRFASSTID